MLSNSINKFRYRNMVFFKVLLKKFNMELGTNVETKKCLF